MSWRRVEVVGATWEPVPLPPGTWARLLGARTNTSCGADGCSVGDAIRLEGWGPLPSTAPDPEDR